MSSKIDMNSSDNENTCVVCFKNVDIYSIGICDHPVCYECSTRMRVLCRQNECPICRQDMPKVVFTKEVNTFNLLKTKVERNNFQDKKFGLLFGSGSIQRAYYNLLEHNCKICQGPNRWPFRNFQLLKDHMRREHELFYCDLCVTNLKIFSSERRCYTRTELALHRRKGDVDNTSHRGHPLCEFCDTRYMDSDELFRHLRRDHLYCHFCDADGKHQYYNSYADLRAHFLEEHYLCEEGECKNEQFTSVFRSDIDLRAHITNVHSRHMSKLATKQARTLELEFTLAPRPRDQGSRGRRNQRNDREEGEEEGAVGYDNYYMEPGGNRNEREPKSKQFVNSMNSAEFPSLGNTGEIIPSSRPTSSLMFTSKITPSVFNGEEFPSLGGNSGSRSQNVTITTHGKVAQKGTTSSRTPEVTITRTIRGSQNLERNSQNFPVLGSASVGNSTVRLSVSSNSQSDRPQSARSNLSIQVTNQSSGAITTKISTIPTSTVQVRPKSTEAFPALSSLAPIPEVQWVAQKTKKYQEPKVTKVADAPVLPPSSLTEFPSLSKFTNEENAKKRSSVTMPVSNSWVNLNNFNTVSRNATKPEHDLNKNDIKLKQEKKEGNKSGNKNIKKDNKQHKANAKESIRSTDKEYADNSSFNEKESKKQEDTKTNNKEGKKLYEFHRSEKFENKIVENEKSKTKKKKQKNSNNNEVNTSASTDILNKEESSFLVENNINKNGIVKKRSELKIKPLEAPNINGFDEFPSLGLKKPPPGFNVVKPPPGFNVSENNISSPNDLTFTSSSGQSYSIIPTLSRNYHLPPNFEIRNKSLIDNFMAVNKSSDAICEFKKYSILFRDGSYSAEMYYKHCKSFLGSDFERIFPELLVLLPDITKQQELYKIHKLNGVKTDLEVCLTCNQVVVSRDLRSHLSHHTLENKFPVLGHTNETSTNYWKK